MTIDIHRLPSEGILVREAGGIMNVYPILILYARTTLALAVWCIPVAVDWERIKNPENLSL